MLDFKPILDNLDFYLTGFAMTITLTVVSLMIGLVIALTFAIIKDGKTTWLIKLIDGFVFYFRGTPCLLQIYLIYFGLAQFEWLQNSILWVAFREPVFCAILVLTLNTCAYTTQIIYGAIKATPKGEIEAGYAFGFNRLGNLRYIILPSVLRRIIPLYANETVFLMQATALVSTITVVELTQVARVINSRFFLPFEAFIFAALFYMTISYAIFIGLHFLEKKLSVSTNNQEF